MFNIQSITHFPYDFYALSKMHNPLSMSRLTKTPAINKKGRPSLVALVSYLSTEIKWSYQVRNPVQSKD